MTQRYITAYSGATKPSQSHRVQEGGSHASVQQVPSGQLSADS